MVLLRVHFYNLKGGCSLVIELACVRSPAFPSPAFSLKGSQMESEMNTLSPLESCCQSEPAFTDGLIGLDGQYCILQCLCVQESFQLLDVQMTQRHTWYGGQVGSCHILLPKR